MPVGTFGDEGGPDPPYVLQDPVMSIRPFERAAMIEELSFLLVSLLTQIVKTTDIIDALLPWEVMK